MQLRLADEQVDIGPDEFEQWEAPVTLDAWKDFACENSRPDATGANVLLVLELANDGSPVEDHKSRYESAFDWVQQHSTRIREAALPAIHRYIHETLIGEYGLDDPDLHRITSPGVLKGEIDLTYLRLSPYQNNGLPYFALEFECNWDPEHGCGVMFHGSEVMDVGMSDTAQGAFDIEGHGGTL